MVQIIQAQTLNIIDLEQKFGLTQADDDQFFSEWYENLPDIFDLEKQVLDQEEFVRDRLDIMVLKDHLWLLVIESKNAGLSLLNGISFHAFKLGMGSEQDAKPAAWLR
ncbi:MAG: hypothetical protein RH949_08635 [Coleofasciculus sp. A1-SPW-01]|uniref:hypothetical protein n=1 Tax=Coleofasciculus sp. A1-SPW-01 TaxID=3070819 RepID=UPI0032F28D54